MDLKLHNTRGQMDQLRTWELLSPTLFKIRVRTEKMRR